MWFTHILARTDFSQGEGVKGVHSSSQTQALEGDSDDEL